MSKVKGWIALYRSIRNHWLYSDEPFDKFHAFIDLLFRAQFEDSKVMIKGQLIELKRGQLLVSANTLSEKWQWSRGKVTRFLKVLEKEEMITVNGTALGTIITIENYTKYQTVRTADGTADSTADGTADSTADSTADGTHINNITNNNNITNKYIKVGTFNNVRLTEDELHSLKDNMTGWKQWIEDLSVYMKSEGRIYNDHYATLWKWYRKNPKKHEKTSRYEGLHLGRDI